MGYFDPGNYSGSKIAGIVLPITSASLVLYGSCIQVPEVYNCWKLGFEA